MEADFGRKFQSFKKFNLFCKTEHFILFFFVFVPALSLVDEEGMLDVRLRETEIEQLKI